MVEVVIEEAETISPPKGVCTRRDLCCEPPATALPIPFQILTYSGFWQSFASHARSYWGKHDARVRQYILQHADMECLARIGSWKDKGSIVASDVGGSQQRPLLLQAPFGELVSASSTWTTSSSSSFSSSSSSSATAAEQEESCYDSDLDDGIPSRARTRLEERCQNW